MLDRVDCTLPHAIWIVLPPHASLLPLAVGAPELCPWLLLLSLILCAVTFRAASVDVASRVVFNIAAVSAVLCAYPLVRAPFVLAAFDNAMKQGLGTDYESQIPADEGGFVVTNIRLWTFARESAAVTADPEGWNSRAKALATVRSLRPCQGPSTILLQLYGGACAWIPDAIRRCGVLSVEG